MYMYIDIDENITGMQDERSLVIHEPPRIAKIKMYMFAHCGPLYL